MVLAPARAAWRWRVPVCAEVVADDGDPVTVDRRVRAVGSAVEELNPAAAGWERAALEEALGSLRPRYYRPTPWTSPHVDGVQVRPGDMVLAFDPDESSWAPRAVLAQWSYLDTDEMATLRLNDGTTVTATDHHRFWAPPPAPSDKPNSSAPANRWPLRPAPRILPRSPSKRPVPLWCGS